MSKMSLLDKIRILIDLSASSKFYLILLSILFVFGFILSNTSKKNEKQHKIIYASMTIVIAVILIASYHSSIGNMFSYMMNNFFIAFYFPTIAIYLAAIIAMNIIVWISIFSFKSSKQIKMLNISIYVIMNYLMALLLKVINSNKLDVFDQASLYGNKEVTALIELSSLVFIVWIMFLILYKVILIYLRKDYKPRIKRVVVRKTVKKLPENYQSTLVPSFVYGKVPHQETLVINTPKTEDEIMLEQFSKQFTLEDYKLFSKLLKEKQEKEKKKKINFIEEDNQKMKKSNKSKKEVVVKSENIKEEDPYREQQKQVIIKMEEERRKLLKEEQERQKQEKLLKQHELEQEIKVSRQKELEEQEKEEQQLELLLQQVLAENEREKRKLSELEMLYR